MFTSWWFSTHKPYTPCCGIALVCSTTIKTELTIEFLSTVRAKVSHTECAVHACWQTSLKCSNQMQFGQEKKISNKGCMYPCPSSLVVASHFKLCPGCCWPSALHVNTGLQTHTVLYLHFGLNLTWTAYLPCLDRNLTTTAKVDIYSLKNTVWYVRSLKLVLVCME